jgi:signal transduction histidine kinase
MDARCDALAALGALVFERLPDGRFRREGTAPAWFDRLGHDARAADALRVEEVFPFLEVFLVEAEAAWASEGARVTSDPWTETAADGLEVHLEATAMRSGGAALLVVTNDERLFVQRRLVLQRARELRMAHDALSREIERKDVLVHCIVHDLANPLNAVLGALSTLEETPLPAEGANMVRVALKAAMRQRGLIREILDVFAWEQGAAQPAPLGPPLDLCAAITAAAAMLEGAARVRRVRVETSVRPGQFCPVLTEETRLQRVLGNLLENALKNSPADGLVQITLEDEGRLWRVAIEDEGAGVPPEVVPQLFEKFARGRDMAAGTGLGLYFCRITVERWGGSIGYAPRAGGGARFWLTLPKAGAAC